MEEMGLEKEEDVAWQHGPARCGASCAECWECSVSSSLGLSQVVILQSTLIEDRDTLPCSSSLI